MQYTMVSSVGVLLCANTLCCDSAQMGGVLGWWDEGAGGMTHIRQHNVRLPSDSPDLRTHSTSLAYNVYAPRPRVSCTLILRKK